MFILMTYLAINIPGNPDVFKCYGVEGTAEMTNKSCITYIRSGTLSIPSAKVTFICEGYSNFSMSDPWTIYPKTGVVVDGWSGRNHICKVTEYKDLIQANRQANKPVLDEPPHLIDLR